MEKTTYEVPKMEMIEIVDADIITASFDPDQAGGQDCFANF